MNLIEKHKNKISYLVTILSLIISLVICFYYWFTLDFESIHKVPMKLIGLILLYLVLQMLKKRIVTENSWWNWLYYIGLSGLLYPIVLGEPENHVRLNWITDFSVLFLLFPIILDFKKLRTPSNSESL
jgi:cell division protein FtsW (lipid II flippase)